MCGALEVSRSSFYAWLRRGECDRRRIDRTLAGEIGEIHHESRGTYGSPRIHEMLRRQGTRCGRKRVARLMRENGLRGKASDGFGPELPTRITRSRSPNLAQRIFAATEPNQLWVADITYIPTVRAGSTWHRLWTCSREWWSGGPWNRTCGPPWSRTR